MQKNYFTYNSLFNKPQPRVAEGSFMYWDDSKYDKIDENKNINCSTMIE